MEETMKLIDESKEALKDLRDAFLEVEDNSNYALALRGILLAVTKDDATPEEMAKIGLVAETLWILGNKVDEHGLDRLGTLIPEIMTVFGNEETD